MKNALIIFTRIPIPGKTKTRMMPYLSAQGCAALHTCFLKDIRRECEKTGYDIFVYYVPEGEKHLLVSILGAGKQYYEQEGEGLGIRMFTAIREVLAKGYDTCLLIGTDVPELDAGILTAAAAKLRTKDVVFGPTRDGGYYLVGMKQPYAEVFDSQTYGHGSVLKNTVVHLREKGITAGCVQTLQDMDEPEDLRDYRRRMKEQAGLRGTATGGWLLRNLKISIIIPVYNEEKTIEHMIEQLRPLRTRCEIIFVDGQSTDRTRVLIGDEFQVIESPKGRAAQMNRGAECSNGDVLLFLHCDSELPKKPLEEIRYVMKTCRAGCFGIGFHSANFFMFTCRVISNVRARAGRLMFGDQGMFIERELFFEMGGFPHIPLMEDYQFSMDLKAKGIIPGMTPHRIYTSDRRFPLRTKDKLKLMWRMSRLRKWYRDGVPAARLAKYYRDVR